MATGPARILYIEDNSDNRLLVKRVLEAEGYRLLEAANAGDGLRQVLTERPDLILMDINLPEVDGYTTTARIKAMPGMEAYQSDRRHGQRHEGRPRKDAGRRLRRLYHQTHRCRHTPGPDCPVSGKLKASDPIEGDGRQQGIAG